MKAPYSRQAGGVWERQIKTVRRVLNSTLSLSHGRLNHTSLWTRAIVSSRLHTADNSPDSLLPLPCTSLRKDLYGAKRCRCVQYLVEQFWSRCKQEFLHNIITGRVGTHKKPSCERVKWRFARILQTGKDGLVRSVFCSCLAHNTLFQVFMLYRFIVENLLDTVPVPCTFWWKQWTQVKVSRL